MGLGFLEFALHLTQIFAADPTLELRQHSLEFTAQFVNLGLRRTVLELISQVTQFGFSGAELKTALLGFFKVALDPEKLRFPRPKLLAYLGKLCGVGAGFLEFAVQVCYPVL